MSRRNILKFLHFFQLSVRPENNFHDSTQLTFHIEMKHVPDSVRKDSSVCPCGPGSSEPVEIRLHSLIVSP